MSLQFWDSPREPIFWLKLPCVLALNLLVLTFEFLQHEQLNLFLFQYSSLNGNHYFEDGTYFPSHCSFGLQHWSWDPAFLIQDGSCGINVAMKESTFLLLWNKWNKKWIHHLICLPETCIWVASFAPYFLHFIFQLTMTYLLYHCS